MSIEIDEQEIKFPDQTKAFLERALRRRMEGSQTNDARTGGRVRRNETRSPS